MPLNRPSDYQAEVARLDAEIAALPDAFEPPLDGERATRLAYRLYQRASLAGDFAALEAVGASLDDLARQLRPASDLYFLKASVDFKFHRLNDVRHALESGGAALCQSLPGSALLADLALEEGRYVEAEQGYLAIIDSDRSWDHLARLAHLRAKMGDVDDADRLYEQAEDELSAKEMRHYAWVELKRGELDLAHGRHAQAHAHYERADRAYSGYWMVAEHQAELLAARGDGEAAAALYTELIARAPRPEFQQALGELYLHLGWPESAEPWLVRAASAYLASAMRGDVHYYHHLADFYADVRKDGAEAVKWARKDLELRENPATLAALAWALYRDGRFAEALEMIEGALASGAQDAHLLHRAGVIHRAAGADGAELLRKAAELNPHFGEFHVHR
jgi:tetratricopeptide (TPR) repeat protein